MARDPVPACTCGPTFSPTGMFHLAGCPRGRPPDDPDPTPPEPPSPAGVWPPDLDEAYLLAARDNVTTYFADCGLDDPVRAEQTAQRVAERGDLRAAVDAARARAFADAAAYFSASAERIRGTGASARGVAHGQDLVAYELRAMARGVEPGEEWE